MLSQPGLESGTALTAKEMRPVNLAAETVTTSRFRLSRRTGTHGGHNTDRRSRSQTFSQGAGHHVWPSSRSGVLFGSRARGDARPDSDYDVAVFLRDMADRFAEMDRLADPGTDICDETGEFVHAMPYRAGSYTERTPLMHELRREGRDL